MAIRFSIEVPNSINFVTDVQPEISFVPKDIAVVGVAQQYEGAYTTTPTRDRQVFHTEGKAMARDFVVEPIPPNYGLITYNGFGITVS